MRLSGRRHQLCGPAHGGSFTSLWVGQRLLAIKGIARGVYGVGGKLGRLAGWLT